MSLLADYIFFQNLLTPMDTSWLDEDINPSPSAEEIYKQFNENTLKIITELPKRPEYAPKQARLNSYNEWPRGHHLRKEDLTDAGFYFAGYGDCARCFYCGGGLRNWELTDNEWVEHARWFPKCAYLRQTKGTGFIDAVKRLNDDGQLVISMEDVMRQLGGTVAGEMLSQTVDPLETDPAVLAVTQMGYRKEDVLSTARAVKAAGETVSADVLFERLFQSGSQRGRSELEPTQNLRSGRSSSRDRETVTTLKEQITQLRNQTVCKICLDNEVSMIYLPCGHFVTCSECSSALETCPVCRQAIRGRVRAYMS